jgi:uncharacterized protein
VIRIVRLRLLPLVVALFGLLWAARVLAIEVPPLEGRVNDRASVLSDAARLELTRKLQVSEAKTGHQVAVLTIPTLGGDPIEDYGMRVVETWKLGREKSDDGVLILVVPNDHKMRIEVGYGLEGVLPDAAAGRITRELMAPKFRQGDWAGGITAGVDAVLGAVGGDAKAAPRSRPHGSAVGGVFRALGGLLMFGIFFVLIIVISIVNRFSGRGRGTVYYGGFGVGGGFGGGGNGGGGFGDGGFSGGGGGFGGGGASGDW